MSVSKIKSIHSIIFHAIYGAVCIQLTNFSYDDYEHICTLSYYHHQKENMTHLPLFRVRLWNNGMRWRSFYILMKMLVPKHEYEFSVVYHTELNIWGCNYWSMFKFYPSYNSTPHHICAGYICSFLVVDAYDLSTYIVQGCSMLRRQCARTSDDTDKKTGIIQGMERILSFAEPIPRMIRNHMHVFGWWFMYLQMI